MPCASFADMPDSPENDSHERSRLWIAPLSGQTYAIPPESPMPPGETLICAIDGELRRVDATAIADQTVPEAMMQRRYRAEFDRGAAVAGAAARAAWRRLIGALPGLETALDAIADEGAIDGPALLAALTGRSVEAVRVDPEGARQAVEAAVAGLAAAPVGAGASDSAGVDAAVEPTTEELDALAVVISRWTRGAGQASQQASQQASPISDLPIAELRERARRLFEALPRPPPGQPDPMRRLLGAINMLYITASDDPLTPSGRARQQASFRADARAHIDEATRDWKPPTPTFAELLNRGRR